MTEEKLKGDKIGAYVLIKRCLRCWKDNDSSRGFCRQCGTLLHHEASEEERDNAMKSVSKETETN